MSAPSGLGDSDAVTLDPALRCRHLRTKTMFVATGDWDEHARAHPVDFRRLLVPSGHGARRPGRPARLPRRLPGRPRVLRGRRLSGPALFVSGVLLAAGASTRFGSPKMLAPVGEDRKPLLRRVLETWLASGFDELIVVLGQDADGIREKIGISHMRRLLMQPPIAGNLVAERALSRARSAHRAAVEDP